MKPKIVSGCFPCSEPIFPSGGGKEVKKEVPGSKPKSISGWFPCSKPISSSGGGKEVQEEVPSSEPEYIPEEEASVQEEEQGPEIAS